MTEHHPPQSLFEKIEHQVRMRPKWRFALEHSTLGIAIFLVAVGLIYFGSFIRFFWRNAQLSALTVFGPEGYGVLFRSFPWWHLLFILIGIVGFIYLIRKGTHLYRWPLIVTIGVFALAFITATIMTDATGLHDRLANTSIQENSLPVIGPLYRMHRGKIMGLVTPGEIISINGNTWRVQLEDDIVKVLITPSTQIPPGWKPSIGDDIVIIGEHDESTILAISCHPAFELPERPPFRMFRPELEFE